MSCTLCWKRVASIEVESAKVQLVPLPKILFEVDLLYNAARFVTELALDKL